MKADGNAGQLDWWAGLAGRYEGPLDVATGNAWIGFGLGYLKSHGAVDARLTSDAYGGSGGIFSALADGKS